MNNLHSIGEIYNQLKQRCWKFANSEPMTDAKSYRDHYLFPFDKSLEAHQKFEIEKIEEQDLPEL